MLLIVKLYKAQLLLTVKLYNAQPCPHLLQFSIVFSNFYMVLEPLLCDHWLLLSIQNFCLSVPPKAQIKNPSLPPDHGNNQAIEDTCNKLIFFKRFVNWPKKKKKKIFLMVSHLVVKMLCFVLRLAIFALAMAFNSGLRLCLCLCLLWFLNLNQTI